MDGTLYGLLGTRCALPMREVDGVGIQETKHMRIKKCILPLGSFILHPRLRSLTQTQTQYIFTSSDSDSDSDFDFQKTQTQTQTFFLGRLRISPKHNMFSTLNFSMLQAPAEACARNEKFERQLELAGPSMSSMVNQVFLLKVGCQKHHPIMTRWHLAQIFHAERKPYKC